MGAVRANLLTSSVSHRNYACNVQNALGPQHKPGLASPACLRLLSQGRECWTWQSGHPHMNWGITRWKVEPLKCRGLPERPVPFSPVHRQRKFCRGGTTKD